MSGVSDDVFVRDLPIAKARSGVTTEGHLTGYAIVFNSLSQNLGGFRERIAPSAVDRTLRSGKNVQAFLDHRQETSSIIGDTDSGLMTLRKDLHGLAFTIRPTDTSWVRDLRQVMKDGLVKKMSFAFRVMPGGEEWEEEGDSVVRTVTDMEFSEISIVVVPAYTETEITARNHAIDRKAFEAYKAMAWKPSLKLRDFMIRSGAS